MRPKSYILIISLLGLSSLMTPQVNVFAQQSDANEPEDFFEMSLEELMNVSVQTASNREEKQSEAPATVIVISREDITTRGYHSMIDILNDLPGMDIILSYGDDYVRNYWRGYRNNISAPYLIMIDGVEFNQLYLNSAGILATFPLSNIEKVEVVYGPASSVYGANAFMGVINVITVKGTDESKASGNVNVIYGDNERSIVDAFAAAKAGKLGFSAAVRFEEGDLRGDDVHDRFEWTNDKYYGDSSLWGGFADEFGSQVRNRGVDLRLSYDKTELVGQYFSLNSGYGYSYPADKGLSDGEWEREEYSIYIRHITDITDDVVSRTMVRYRESNIPRDSWFIENYNGFVDFSYWQSLNSSWIVSEDFEISISDQLSVLTGIEYEWKDLQKAYDINYGPSVLPANADPSTYPYPAKPSDHQLSDNRIQTEDWGVYVQAKQSLGEHHTLHAGVRQDDNSTYGSAVTWRGGYVGTFDKLTAKLLYGEAYQAPSARLLYGGWTGTGSAADLSPEESQTLEFSLGYAAKKVSHLVSVYQIHNSDTILTLADGARNIGDRDVYGIDYHLQAILQAPFMKKLKLHGYYSYIYGSGDEKYNSATDSYKAGRIGDIAHHKVNAIATAYFTDKLTGSLRGRYVGERKTIDTNPVDKVADYVTLDFNLLYKVKENLSFSLRVDNIFDEEYEHPGIRSADSGADPGYWDGGGSWHGSQGWFNSLVPQPGRTLWLSACYKF